MKRPHDSIGRCLVLALALSLLPIGNGCREAEVFVARRIVSVGAGEATAGLLVLWMLFDNEPACRYTCYPGHIWSVAGDLGYKLATRAPAHGDCPESTTVELHDGRTGETWVASCRYHGRY